ncbi:cardiolipin synthase ClsB [Pseudomonas aeruginosa]|uniref:cardiolipin synthase ClsB n=1 Tax=Pseudomonas aeruginosa TaxID=287 RepID=UPI000F62057E|nr:cardiolipin synthase ClsB [Pseudomonas aeruginosa]RRI52856.1 cardiolipin synthase ClsB [Pseudomonas aeruginosa]
MNFPWRDGNRLELLINGEEYFPRLFQCIAEARREILLETFIIFEDEVGRQLQEALSAAAERGVEVQVTVDGYGTASLSPDYLARLTASGVRVHLFDPRPRLLGMRTNLFRRLHRKLVVIDRRQAFVGGINYGEDHLVRRGNMAKQDYAVRVEGPVVRDIHQACLALLEPDADYPPLRPSGAGQPARVRLVIRDNDQSSDDIEREYLQAIRQARRRLLIANAYFFPGYRLLRELRDAARRGVRVDLVLQGMPDMPLVRLCSRLLYDYLLREGVRIHEYCQRPLHDKVAVIDDDWSTIGSSNLDPLSLSLNLEANLVIHDVAFNGQLYQHLRELARRHCRRISRRHARRGYWWRAPLIFLGFHFSRHFPAIAGWVPAHLPRLKSLEPRPSRRWQERQGQRGNP